MEYLRQNRSATALSLNMPKNSIPELEMKNNYYIVTNGTIFNYYSIKVKPDDGSPLIKFEKSPPVILEGWAIINKKIYHVTVKDLLRRIIRKSRETSLEVINGNSSGTTSGATTASIGTNQTSAIQHTDQQGLVSETELEISEAANLTWSEQMSSLLSTISEKEGIAEPEWEITDIA